MEENWWAHVWLHKWRASRLSQIVAGFHISYKLRERKAYNDNYQRHVLLAWARKAKIQRKDVDFGLRICCPRIQESSKRHCVLSRPFRPLTVHKRVLKSVLSDCKKLRKPHAFSSERLSGLFLDRCAVLYLRHLAMQPCQTDKGMSWRPKIQSGLERDWAELRFSWVRRKSHNSHWWKQTTLDHD